MTGTPLPTLEDRADADSIDDFLDVFDRLALKGQSVRPVLPPAHQPRVPGVPLYVLADEFGLTTAQALDVCERAGVRADYAGTELGLDDAERFRTEARRPPVVEEEEAPMSLRARLDGLGYHARVLARARACR